MKKLFALLLIFSLLNAKTIVVDKMIWFPCVDGDLTTNSIADALNNAENGDEIIICKNSSSYNEDNLVIKHDNLFIHSDTNNSDDVVIEGSNNIFNLNDNWIKNFKLKGITLKENGDNNAAIYNSEGGEDWNFTDLNITSQGYGIYSEKEVKDFNISNSEINSSKDALDIKNPKGLNVIDTNISSDSGYIAYINDSYSDVNFSSTSPDNILQGKYGIYFYDASKNYYINGYKIITTDDNAAPIGLDKAAILDVENCDLNSSGKGSGIYVSGQINDGLNIKNNYIHDMKNESIYINKLYDEGNFTNNTIDGGSYGISLGTVTKELNLFSNDIENASSYNLYIDDATSNSNVDIEKNVFNNGTANIYIKKITSAPLIKNNIIKNASNDAGIHLLESDDNIGSKIYYNCFYDNQDYQVYNQDEGAVFDDGETGNYWSDWNGSGTYTVTKYGQDNHPLSECNLFLHTPVLVYRMDECSWDSDDSTYEIKNYGRGGNDYNATALNDANVTIEGKICNGGDINSSQNENEAILAKNDYALPSEYTINVWIKFPLNTDGHKTFSSGFFGNSYSYFNIADRKGSDNDLIYFKENTDNSTWELCVKDDDGEKCDDFNPQNLSDWHMLTFTINDSNTTFYLDGDYNYTFDAHPNTGNLGLLFNSDYQADNDDEPNGQSIGAKVDEFELYKGNLSNDDISKLYNNENNGKNYNGDNRKCPNCFQKSYTFDIRDVWRDSNDTNISTKTVNKDFNLTVASYDENKSDLQDFNGTVCVQVIDDNDNNLTPWKKMDDFLNDVNESNWTDIKIDSARSKVKVTVQWKKDSDEDCPLSDEDNETNSSDEFALRPYRFRVTNIPAKIRAGEEFNITVQALDYEGNPTKDYNGTAVNIKGDTVDLEYNISKSGCLDGNLTKQSDENFSNGEVNVTLKYDEVGELNLTLKEVNGSEFAKVDEDDSDENTRFIEENRTTITVVPYKFEINADVRNFDNSFTYLDNNLSVYSLLEINISAESKDGNITENYNKECYAKNIEINVSKELNPSPDLNNVLYFYRDVNESNSSVISQDINSDIEINYSDTNFTTDNNGSTTITLFINFDRNSSKSVSPFEMNVSEINVSDGDANGTKDNIGKSLYYYGNFILFDEESNESNFTTKDEYFVIYNQNGGDGNGTDEILPDWYLNNSHNSIDGNISNANIIVSSDYNASNTISDVNVTLNTLSNGTVTFDVNRSGNSRKFAVIHLLEPNLKWLWYSKFGNEYNISSDSSCLNHFCFSVNWQSESGGSQVISGQVNGTEANTSSGNTRKRGTKIFR